MRSVDARDLVTVVRATVAATRLVLPDPLGHRIARASASRHVSAWAFVAVLATAHAAAQPAPRAGDGAWEPAGVRDGVTLAFRDGQAAGVREVRATAELPAAAARVAELVCDLPRYVRLLPGLREARVVATHGPGHYDVYMQYAPRFIVVAARDVVARVVPLADSSGTLGCTWQHVDGLVAPARGVVRMPLLRGSWHIDAIGSDRARVRYEVAADPGGRLPGWLVRRGALNTVPDVIARVRQALVTSPVP